MTGTGDGYVGSAQDAVRIRRLEKQREAERRKIEELMTKSASDKGRPGLLRFGSSTSEILETAFKKETAGLVTREQYVEKRVTIQNKIEEEEKEKQQKLRQEEEEAQLAKRKKRKVKGNSKLSFSDDFEDGVEDEDSEIAARACHFLLQGLAEVVDLSDMMDESIVEASDLKSEVNQLKLDKQALQEERDEMKALLEEATTRAALAESRVSEAWETERTSLLAQVAEASIKIREAEAKARQAEVKAHESFADKEEALRALTCSREQHDRTIANLKKEMSEIRFVAVKEFLASERFHANRLQTMLGVKKHTFIAIRKKVRQDNPDMVWDAADVWNSMDDYFASLNTEVEPVDSEPFSPDGDLGEEVDGDFVENVPAA